MATTPLVTSEFIDTQKTYASVHASTIVECGGKLLSSWFGGSGEGNTDVGIWLSRYADAGWTDPMEVASGIGPDSVRYPCWNPVLFQPSAGPLLLFYKVGPNVAGWWGMLVKSYDCGETWSAPERLPEGILGPIKNKPIQLAEGAILCPSSDEKHGWQVRFERFDPDRVKWTSTGPINDGRDIRAIQPSLLRHRATRLQAIGRSQSRRMFSVFSEDAGETWGEMALLDIPNPNSGTDAVTLADGRFLLVYNHSKTARTPLDVAISRDGIVWRQALTLEDSPGEYSYPAVIQTSDSMVHITYTWRREQIKHISLDPGLL